MTKYLISFPGPAVDIPDEDRGDVGEAAHAVIREAKNAAVQWAAKSAEAYCCPRELREFQYDPRAEERMMSKPTKNRICLWYDGDAEEAARFYAETFPDSSVDAVHYAPGDFPSGSEGDALTVEFTVMGIPCLGLNGGPTFKHSEAFSFQVATTDQTETDRYWNAIIDNGGEESACGWCKDKWGLSWQITPIALTKAITDPDRAAARRAFDAMMQMRKVDIAAIEAAHRG